MNAQDGVFLHRPDTAIVACAAERGDWYGHETLTYHGWYDHVLGGAKLPPQQGPPLLTRLYHTGGTAHGHGKTWSLRTWRFVRGADEQPQLSAAG